MNVFRYAIDNPSNFADPLGLDIWIEGPSGSEPDYHQSINVGDSNGSYTSVSFGITGFSASGEVYLDYEKGGEIQAYVETTQEQDDQARRILLDQAGIGPDAGEPLSGLYSPLNNCRSYSQDRFNDFKSDFGAEETPPPDRDPAPREKWRSYGGVTSRGGLTSSTTTTTTRD